MSGLRPGTRSNRVGITHTDAPRRGDRSSVIDQYTIIKTFSTQCGRLIIVIMIATWAHMAPHGPILCHIGRFVPILRHMGACAHVVPSGTRWDHIPPYGTMWVPMAPYGPYGLTWPHISHMETYGEIGCHTMPYIPYVVICCQLVPYGAKWCHMVSYGAIWGHIGPQ